MLRKHNTKTASNSDVVQVVNNSKGRGSIVKREVNSGQLLSQFRPTISSIRSQHFFAAKSTFCQNCLEIISLDVDIVPISVSDHISSLPDKSLATCRNCGVFKYCSYLCFVNHYYSIHKDECKIFQNLFSNGYTNIDETTSLLIQLYLTCKTNRDISKKIHSLVSHSQKFRDKTIVTIMEESCKEIASAINQCSTDSEIDFNEIFNFLCIILVNSNAFINSKFEVIGTMLSVEFSLINHSCTPNFTVITNESSTISLISTQLIPAEGELFTTYVDSTLPFLLRQRILQNQYFFNCKCKLCKSKYDVFFSYNCPKCNLMLLEMSFTILLSDESLQEKKCKSCQQISTKEVLTNARNAHKKLFISILTALTSTHSEVIINDDFSNFTLDDLLNLTSSINFESLEIENEKQYSYFKTLYFKVISNNIIPIYCFPCLSVLHALANYVSDKRSIEHLKASMYYEVNIAILGEISVDLSQSSVGLSKYLGDLSSKMIEINEKMLIANEPIDPELSIMYFVCATYFLAQAISYLKESESRNCQWYKSAEQILIQKSISITTFMKKHESSIENFTRWTSRKSYNDSDFTPYLRKFFSYYNIPIKKNKKLQYVDRQFYELFKPKVFTCYPIL